MEVLFKARFNEMDVDYIRRDIEEFNLISSMEDKGFECWIYESTLYLRGKEVPDYKLDKYLGLSLWDWDTMVKPIETTLNIR